MRYLALFALSAAAVAGVSGVAPTQEKKDAKTLPPIATVDLKLSEPVDYSKHVEPIFENRCTVCHSGNTTRGKYDMSTYAGVMKGGKRGAAVVPGKSAESNLFLFCARQKQPVMPPADSDEPCTPQEVTLLKLWIDQGAKAPATARVKKKIVVSLPPAQVRPVRAVAVSPDGTVVAAGRGNQVHLYDAKKGDYLKTLTDPQLRTPDGKEAKAAHISLVESMAFAPDGKTLATGSFQELTLWDAEKGTVKGRLTGFADRVVAVAYSPDGGRFATAGGPPAEDGEVKVFSAAGKQELDIRNGHSDTVYALAFSPDGKLLATGAADKFVKVFEVPGGKHLKSFEGHTHHVMGVGWTPDGKKLASCGADNFVKVWDYEKGEKLRDMTGHTKQVTGLAFVGKAPQFLTCSGDQSVRMWNADNGGNIRQFPGATDYVYAVAASPDGKVVAAGGEEGVVRIYNGQNGTLVKAALPPDAEPKKDNPPAKK
jgi:WD40 repeat protein